jgi:hypothetical protein
MSERLVEKLLQTDHTATFRFLGLSAAGALLHSLYASVPSAIERVSIIALRDKNGAIKSIHNLWHHHAALVLHALVGLRVTRMHTPAIPEPIRRATDMVLADA